ncbi:RNA-binding protein [Haloglomus salinum]|jgi:PUA-domain protein|uniref:RNA-binding protein n=1 Tax=Haloglomus salinum TaxID=2962673 RepID=UPI0020C9AA8B|nr:RNA-binding protein [Haloglomus salinum]
MDVKSRHHLRGDEIDEIVDHIADRLGVTVEGDAWEDVEFVDDDRRVVLVDGEPAVAFYDGEPFLTVQGANQFPPESRIVTVDAGAVSFVSDGANVMRPGIVEADDAIDPGDLVVIAEETHGKVLAVGRADVPGDEMVGESGKVVDSLHHVGDDLFEFSV